MHIKQILILLVITSVIRAEKTPARLSMQFRSAYFSTSNSVEYLPITERFQYGPYGELNIRIKGPLYAGLTLQHMFRSVDIDEYYWLSTYKNYYSCRTIPISLRFAFSGETGTFYIGYIVTPIKNTEPPTPQMTGDPKGFYEDSSSISFLGFETGCAIKTKLLETNIIFRISPSVFGQDITPSVTVSLFARSSEIIRAGILFESIYDGPFMITPLLRLTLRDVSIEAGPGISSDYLFHGKPSPVLRFGAGFAY